MNVQSPHNQQSGRYIIERATERDLDRILQIEQESFSAPWTRKMFEVELNENPFGHLYTARAATESLKPEIAAGYVCFWVVFEELRLMTLAIDCSARRRGVGTELLRYALVCGRFEGASRALLEVRESNAAALRLYEQAGFCRTAVREQYYTNPREDAILMEKDLLVGANGE
jgi:ribosomal-protein-alanine N-acetyltransferase